ncbi:hypothetical protein CISIN_1g038719mg, partial [Citrus sinensis]
RPASTTFTVHGFRNWKKFNDGKKCAFLVHMGESHNAAEKSCANLMNPSLREKICEEIGDSKYCILVDETKDESKKEQMALVWHFVDNDGFIRERFFDILHVKDTTSMALKKELSSILCRYALDVQNMRGQGYASASNMCGEWNGLQALFLGECPYAYYIHCMAHRLQLALIAASREVIHRNSELQSVQIHEIANMIAIDELETGDADSTYNIITSFDFVFILHLVKEILGITDILCQALQHTSQDILNVMHHVSTTRALIQKMREDSWDSFLETTKSFCE